MRTWRGGGRRAVRVRGSWGRHQRRSVRLAWFLVQSAFLALDYPSLAPRNAETSPSGAKQAVALAFSMRHTAYHFAPIVPYLEYRFASIIDRRTDHGEYCGEALKNTDDLVGCVFDNITDLICNYQRRDKLEPDPTCDVSDAHRV
jgi:hypothetical protein